LQEIAMNKRLFNLQRNITTPAGGGSAMAAGPLNYADVSDFGDDLLVYVDAPALTTGQLPDGETLTYAIVQSQSQNLSSPTSTTVIGVQTGAGGVGAAAAVFAGRLASAGPWFAVKITASASASAAGLTIPMKIAAPLAHGNE
jgi:hypothetical protein